ncbi:MAG: PAS domain S-box protein, partial [Chloroflexi bacterium]|nr:PAS domain S-box protein [Chloroflexota bacterium]
MKEHGRATFLRLTQPAPALLPHARWLLLLFTVAVSINVLTLLYFGGAGHSAIWLLVLIDLVALAGSGYCLAQMLRVHEQAIANQARLTEQIELRDARFRALVQNTSDIVVILDATGQVVYRSPGAERADMLPPQVLTGSSAFEFIHPEDVPRARAFLQEIFQTPRVNLTRDLKLRRADGSWRDFEVVAINLIDEPAVAGIVVTCRDITERKLAELALRASEARNRALVDAIPDMMFRISRGGIYLDFKPSNRFTPLLPSEAFLGKRLSDSLPTDLAECSLRAIEQALETGEPQILEYQLLHEGELRDYEARIVVSAPDEVIAIVRDVTEPRRLEEELRETQKMESIGRLAGGIAHDFNNLLTVIGGCSELLLLDLPENATDQRETVGEIQQAADRAAALTKQLLAFSRKQMLAPQVVQLNEVVAETSAMLRRVLGEHVQIALDLEPALGTVRVDRGQIQQVVMNLAINGRDAMPSGGRLTIATRNARESGGTSHQDGGSTIGEFVVLTVSDTGSGIDAATRARIFEPFFTTKE